MYLEKQMMNASIYVTWNVMNDKPLSNILLDDEPRFNLILFEYSGNLKNESSITIKHVSWENSCFVHSEASEGKGDIIRHLAKHIDESSTKYIGIIDDDILIRVSDLNRALELGVNADLASFQPSLARCSHYSHEFTVNQQNSIVRKVDWVEIMMPIMKSELLWLAKPFLELSISSWGLDCYLFPMLALTQGVRGGHAVIDASIAAHVRPITSGAKIYRNGFTAQQEMMVVKEACIQYLNHISYKGSEIELLSKLFDF